MKVQSRPFGTLPGGREVTEWIIVTPGGTTLGVIDFGAIITRLALPDRNGTMADVVMGFDDLAAYHQRSPYFGAIVGRVANRIAHGRFTLDGATHQLSRNEGVHHLHGGASGFDRAAWSGTPHCEADRGGVTLRLSSPHGDQGYPGTLDASVRYDLDRRGWLSVRIEAAADRATPVNLAQHSYFNLAGHDTGTVAGHLLELAASRYLPVDREMIPLGTIAPVDGTPFDFRSRRAIGDPDPRTDAQLEIGGGYDHCWVLDGPGLDRAAATVVEPASGRRMRVYTTEPGVQFYGGNRLDGLQGKDGATYCRRGALCLETQHFPDSPNRPDFPSVILRPGSRYRSVTLFAFDTVEEGP